MNAIFSAAALAIGMVCLAACTSISPAGLIAASRLDPLNTPPERIGVAVSVPSTVGLRDGDAALRIAFAEGEETLVDTSVPLAIMEGGPEAPAAEMSSENVYVATIQPEEAEAFAAAQDAIKRLRAAGVEGKGSLSISVAAACRRGAPLQSLPVATWLRTEPTGPFVPLTRRRDVLDDMGALASTLPPC